MSDTDPKAAADVSNEQSSKPPLSMDVQTESRGACIRHVVVRISAEDVARYRDQVVDELVNDAFVPGFRPGRAPRQLVAMRYRNEINNRVKSALLIDSLDQLSKEQKIVPIGEPQLELDEVVIADEGPMTFEFDIEVRPTFELPKWKGLQLKELTYEATEEDIDAELKRLLVDHSTFVPHAGPAQLEDLVTLRLRFRKDGQLLREIDEVTVPLRPEFLLRDARIENVDQLLVGKSVPARVTGQATLSESMEDERLRGSTVDVEMELLDIKRQRLPELTPSLLRQLGEFESVDDLRRSIRQSMNNRFEYYRQDDLARQITEKLLAGADWDLPTDMLRRQARRELERLEMELASRGFSAADIEAHANRLRYDAFQKTATALRRHFILERIAEEEHIEVTDEDLEKMVAVIAKQRGESPRRVWARLEKRGSLDVIRNQVIETRVLELIVRHAHLEKVPFSWPKKHTSPLAVYVLPEVDIPEAKAAEAEKLRQPEFHG